MALHGHCASKLPDRCQTYLEFTPYLSTSCSQSFTDNLTSLAKESKPQNFSQLFGYCILSDLYSEPMFNRRFVLFSYHLRQK